eukprot:gnl/Spiro4/21261_TR10377_c0_g1_i1.p1 gnl/Spiro4/21261_TR10377_c0_g1~~gnl/Spiro4/21261_TR10377_c0_g1_i1.p1  ORF type:complete len:296 (-),score=77.56 gnl/Spiro4/21261_TR10377_c0_g1_i1:81-968(-)
MVLSAAIWDSINVVTIASLLGWLYFACWSLSFYPQVFENRHRESVVGVSFDLLVYNFTGYTCYMLYNILLRYSPAVKELYAEAHPESCPDPDNCIPPVHDADLAFSIHAFILTTFTIYQCLIYEQGDQEVSAVCKGLSAHVILSIFTVTTAAVVRIVDWLWLVNYLGYVKIFISLIKYIPQVYLNYSRKSTHGFAIGMVLLDFMGGVFSVLQMILLAVHFDDVTQITGNLPKLLLGLVSVVFDIIFIIQHYVLYQTSVMEHVGGMIVSDYDTDYMQVHPFLPDVAEREAGKPLEI